MSGPYRAVVRELCVSSTVCVLKKNKKQRGYTNFKFKSDDDDVFIYIYIT